MIQNRGFIIRGAALLVHELSIETDIDLTKKSRERKYVVPRNVCCFLLRQELKLTLDEISNIFGKGHHSTIINCLKRVEECFLWKDDTSLTYQLYYTEFLGRFKELAKSMTCSEDLNAEQKSEVTTYSEFIDKLNKQLTYSISLYDDSVKEAADYKKKYISYLALFKSLKGRFDKLKDEHEKLKSISPPIKNSGEIKKTVRVARNNREVYNPV